MARWRAGPLRAMKGLIWRHGRWLMGWLMGWLLALALALVLWRTVAWAPLLTALQQLPAWAWALAVAGLLAGHGLRAWRLQAEWRHRGAVGWAECLRLVLWHNAAVVLMPLRTGEAGYVWLVHRRWGVAWRDAALSLLWWRLQDAVALLLWLLLLVPAWTPGGRVVLGLSLAVALAQLWGPLQQRWLPRRWRRQPVQPQAGWWCSLSQWSLKLAVACGLLAQLTGLPPLAAARAALGGELAGVQPLQGVAGLGSYEGGVWLGAGLAGHPAAAVLGAAVAAHALSLAVALGAAALASWWPRAAAATPTPVSDAARSGAPTVSI